MTVTLCHPGPSLSISNGQGDGAERCQLKPSRPPPVFVGNMILRTMRDPLPSLIARETPWWNPRLHVGYSIRFVGRWSLIVLAGSVALQMVLTANSYLLAWFQGARVDPHPVQGGVILSNPLALAGYCFVLAVASAALAYGVYRRNCLGWWMVLGLGVYLVEAILRGGGGWQGAAVWAGILMWWLIFRRERAGIPLFRRTATP